MRLRSQFLIQLTGAGLSTLAFILLTPVLVSSLGLERYGILLLVLGFLIYTNLAELGLGGAVAREIAACEEEMRNRIFGNALLLSIVLACLGGVLFSLLAMPDISRRFVSDPLVVKELSQSAGALFALGAFSMFGTVPKGVLFGLSRFIPLNLVSIMSAVGSLLAPALYASFSGSDLPGLIASVAFAHLATLSISGALCLFIGTSPELRFEASIARTLLAYGGWSTASGVIHRLTNSLDRPLISAFVGSAAVPLFAIPEGALNRGHLVSSALLSAAFPRLVRSPYDPQLIETCYRGVLLMTPVFVIGIVFIQPLLHLWLGSPFANAANMTAILLAIAIWFEIIGRVPYAILQARSEMRKETGIAAIIFVPNLVILVSAIYFFGVVGAAACAIARSSAFLAFRAMATKSAGNFKLLIFANSTCLLIVSMVVLQYEVTGSLNLLVAGVVVAFALACYLNFRCGLSLAQSFFPVLRTIGRQN